MNINKEKEEIEIPVSFGLVHDYSQQLLEFKQTLQELADANNELRLRKIYMRSDAYYKDIIDSLILDGFEYSVIYSVLDDTNKYLSNDYVSNYNYEHNIKINIAQSFMNMIQMDANIVGDKKQELFEEYINNINFKDAMTKNNDSKILRFKPITRKINKYIEK